MEERCCTVCPFKKGRTTRERCVVPWVLWGEILMRWYCVYPSILQPAFILLFIDIGGRSLDFAEALLLRAFYGYFAITRSMMKILTIIRSAFDLNKCLFVFYVAYKFAMSFICSLIKSVIRSFFIQPLYEKLISILISVATY